MQGPILQIENLHISFKEDGVYHEVIHGISAYIQSGLCTGIIGESGSGKSVTFTTSIGLLSEKGKIDQGVIKFYSSRGWMHFDSNSKTCPWLGQETSIIFQEPLSSLNPTMRCGKQIEEAMLHSIVNRKLACLDALEQVQIEEPERVYSAYPHEISGGQRQRVMIAMALARNPLLLVADEPTTALDPKVQSEVLNLLKGLCTERNIALVLISHDLDAVQTIADEVYVFNNGKIMEHGSSREVLNKPKHPYTKALIQSKKAFGKFNLQLPKMSDLMDGSYKQIHRLKPQIGDEVLEVNSLSKIYPSGKGLKPININLKKGEVLAIAGRSGSGKSTLAKLLLQIETKDGGVMNLNGIELVDNPERFRWIQMVFQDPYSSLHPSKRVKDALTEVLLVNKLARTSKQAFEKVVDVLQTVGLSQEALDKFPHQFSGGQRQRISIARALLMEPEVIVMDESVAALDLSIQAKIINLLIDIQVQRNISYIFITHDIHVMEYFADRVMVLANGELIKEGRKLEILPFLKEHFQSE